MLGALALAISTTIGAGVLGLPKALYLTGFPAIAITVVVALFLNITAVMLSDMLKREKKPIQIPALISNSIGSGWKYFVYLTLIFSMYGAISAYLIGFGNQVNALFGLNDLYGGLLLFLVCGFFIFKGTKIIEKIDRPLSFALVVFLIAISTVNIFHVKEIVFAPVNLTNLMKFTGTMLFALFGLNVLPEVNYLSKGKAAKVFLLTTVVCSLLYLMFAFTTVGVLGPETTDLGTKGLAVHYGGVYNIIISLFTMTALFSPFLGIGLSLRHIYEYDFRFSRLGATAGVVFPPLLVFLMSRVFGFGFLDILGIAGELTLPLFAIIATYAYVKVLPAIKTSLPFPKIVAAVSVLFYSLVLGISLFDLIL